MTDFCLETFVKARAKEGWSRQMVAQTLEIGMTKFRNMIDAMGDIDWPKQGHSIVHKAYYDSMRGVPNPKKAIALAKGRAAREYKCTRYTIGGFTGTAKECWEHWSPHCGVSLCQFRRRLKTGHDPFFALFVMSQVHKGWGNMPKMNIGW